MTTTRQARSGRKEPIWKITVRLPARLQPKVEQRARAAHQSINQTIIEAVEAGLEQPLPQLSEREKVQQVLKEAGMLQELGPEFYARHIKGPIPTLDEVRAIFKGQPPLSEEIIEMRGEV